MELNRDEIKRIIVEILKEKASEFGSESLCPSVAEAAVGARDGRNREQAAGLIKVHVPGIQTSAQDRLDTGTAGDRVYTHDLFSLSESPRLGCGVMEMEETAFAWNLNYDEIDYVIEGELTIVKDGRRLTAGPGELILIPKGSAIQFSVPKRARFLYVTYPADWNA